MDRACTLAVLYIFLQHSPRRTRPLNKAADTAALHVECVRTTVASETTGPLRPRTTGSPPFPTGQQTELRSPFWYRPLQCSCRSSPEHASPVLGAWNVRGPKILPVARGGWCVRPLSEATHHLPPSPDRFPPTNHTIYLGTRKYAE